MKIFKKNQVIIYIIALMLVTAGYLNYTTNFNDKGSLETSVQMEAKDDTQLADIGDAKLVNSNDVVSEDVPINSSNEINNITTNNTSDNTTSSNEISNNIVNNTTNTNSISNTTSNSVKESNSSSSTSVETSSTNSDEYFTKSKLDRDSMYSQMLETYEKILSSNNSLETQKQSASEEIKKINNTKNSIMICENLILIKGFDDCVIFVNGNSISVIVKDDELSVEEVAKIQNIISREMNAQIENIHIQSK